MTAIIRVSKPYDLSVAQEILRDDVYHAERVFAPVDRWLDVGCHHGWFSLLARLHGAHIACAVDADREVVDRYELLNEVSVTVDEVASSNQLAKHVDATRANAVKIDIQGAESFLVHAGGFEWTRGTLVKKLLIEWHYPDWTGFVDVLEDNGFAVVFADEATDILTGENTYIIYAEKRS